MAACPEAMRFERTTRNSGHQHSCDVGSVFNRFARRLRPPGRGTPSGGERGLRAPAGGGGPACKLALPLRTRAIQSAGDLRGALVTHGSKARATVTPMTGPGRM